MTDAELLAAHEAAHAAAPISLDAQVLSVDTIGDERHLGRTRAVYADTPEGTRKRMQVVLAGLIQTVDAPAWPPRTDRSTDEGNCASSPTTSNSTRTYAARESRGAASAHRRRVTHSTATARAS